MCVDDLVCQGAEPLFFLDYQALGQVDPGLVGELMVRASPRAAGRPAAPSSAASWPSIRASMDPDDFDLVGFAVGIAERDRMLDGRTGRRGRRSHRAALARPAQQRVLAGPAGPARTGRPAAGRPGLARRPTTLADELLVPSVIYAPAVVALFARR